MRPAALATLSLALASCATNRVTLLENEPGSANGAVAVLGADGQETVIDQVNSQAALRDGPTRVKVFEQVPPEYGQLFGYLPPKETTLTVKFATGSSELSPEELETLRQAILAEKQRRAGMQVEVAAFTDSVDSDESNLDLSQRRAQGVVKQLQALGLDVADDDAVGRGEFDAKKALGDNVASEDYRKVDIVIR